MYLKHLQLYGYRNYVSQQVDLNRSMNVLIGENGQGKTNLLEAIDYLANGSSFRGNKDMELIQWKKEYFRIVGALKKESSERLYQIDLYYDSKKQKQIKINEVKYKSVSALQDYLRVIVFSPDDLKIVKDAPAIRRQYIDRGMMNFYPMYETLLHQYERVLQQRNNLLKELQYYRQHQQQLAIWNQYLEEYGSQIIYERLQYLKQLIPTARKIQHQLTEEKERFTVTYHCSLGAIGDYTQEEIKRVFHEILEKNQEAEIQRGVTLFGPQRDDLIFYLNGNELKKYGSQGQQRTAILALKIAELQIFEKKYGEYPLLLLDDVMSELDDKRRVDLLTMIRENQIQTIITGTNFDFMWEEISENELFYIQEGNIIKK